MAPNRGGKEHRRQGLADTFSAFCFFVVSSFEGIFSSSTTSSPSFFFEKPKKRRMAPCPDAFAQLMLLERVAANELKVLI